MITVLVAEEAAAVEVGHVQIGALEVGPVEDSALEIALPEGGAGEVRVAEAAAREVGVVHLGGAQADVVEGESREVQPAEVDVLKGLVAPEEFDDLLTGQGPVE